MKITNKLGLPDAIVRAVTNDPYNKGDCAFSITELLQPPRIRALKKKHEDEIVEDAADRIWSLLGQSIHTILERSNNPDNAISEKRYFAEFAGYMVSAQIDSLELSHGALVDYKTTTSYKFKTDQSPPPEYVAQLNGQLEILRRNGLDARELKITGILRDWNMREAKSNPGYPQFQVATLEIPMWSREEASRFIEDRIRRHLAAEKDLPFCSPEERWASPDKYAIMKGTSRRAVKLVDSMAEAMDYVTNMGPGHRVESRKSESRRCSSYCAVNKFCTWYQEQLKGEVE